MLISYSLSSFILWMHLFFLCPHQVDIANCDLYLHTVDIQTWQRRDTRSSYFWFACSRSHPWSIQCNSIRDTYSGKIFHHWCYFLFMCNGHLVINGHKVFLISWPVYFVNFTMLWYNDAGSKTCSSCTSNFVWGSWWAI